MALGSVARFCRGDRKTRKMPITSDGIAVDYLLAHEASSRFLQPLHGSSGDQSSPAAPKARHFWSAIPQLSTTSPRRTRSTTAAMGVQPQLFLTHVHEQMTKLRRGSSAGRWHRPHEPPQEAPELKDTIRIHKLKLTHFSRSHAKKVVEAPGVRVAAPLPEEAQQLKETILRTHKNKPTRFSLSHMKMVIVPPVEIPKEMNCRRALTMTVSGRNVPLTRCMWDNTKRRVHHMEQISESYPLDCTLFR